MVVTLLNPPGLPEVPIYHQVAIGSGSRLVFVAGQVSWGEDGEIVGPDDLGLQVEQCLLNAATALAGAGATMADVVDITAFVVDWTPDLMPQLVDGLSRAAEQLGGHPMPPSSLIGVAALDVPEHLVEVKVTAVIE